MIPAPISSPLARVLQAASFAATRHCGQLRDGPQGIPYINHPLAVAECLITAGVEDPDILAAALLHDTVEDTNTTLIELETLFGRRVASIVAEVTDDTTLTRDERKRRQVTSAPTKSHEAKLVKLADKLCNLRDLGESPPDWTADRMDAYYRFSVEVYRGLRGSHAALDSQMDHLLEQYLRRDDHLADQ